MWRRGVCDCKWLRRGLVRRVSQKSEPFFPLTHSLHTSSILPHTCQTHWPPCTSLHCLHPHSRWHPSNTQSTSKAFSQQSILTKTKTLVPSLNHCQNTTWFREDPDCLLFFYYKHHDRADKIKSALSSCQKIHTGFHHQGAPVPHAAKDRRCRACLFLILRGYTNYHNVWGY